MESAISTFIARIPTTVLTRSRRIAKFTTAWNQPFPATLRLFTSETQQLVFHFPASVAQCARCRLGLFLAEITTIRLDERRRIIFCRRADLHWDKTSKTWGIFSFHVGSSPHRIEKCRELREPGRCQCATVNFMQKWFYVPNSMPLM